MAYINRLFFRKDNGACIYRYWQKGHIKKTTIEQDLAAIKPLNDYIPEAVIVVEVSEGDLETQKKLNTCSDVVLDIATNELRFIFAGEEDVEIEENPVQQVSNKLDLLIQMQLEKEGII